MALPLYAITLFVSAFILFLVQPMIGKMVLPKLGGTPQVWNTCMVFFQMVLLAGYAYTHTISTRLKLRQQLILHGIMLVVPFIVLLPIPFNIRGWIPALGVNPIPSTLWVLFLYVALPFLVVSTTAPLLQKWFVYTGHPAAKDPYFLYGASNFGSMLALLAYPFMIEPFTSLQNETFSLASQPWIWTVGFIALAVLVYTCAALVWAPARVAADAAPAEPAVATPEPAAAATTAATTGVGAGPPPGTGIKKGPRGPGRAAPGARHDLPAEPDLTVPRREEVTVGRRVRWVLLAAIPSSLMLGVTTFITTDLSPIPLFWLIPLTLYLLSFILVFARWPVVWVEHPHTAMLYAQPIAIALMLFVGYLNAMNSGYLWSSVFFFVLGFFLTTMVCHGELAKDRPSTRYLTEFYLWMSVGGMLGGMFNALLAPVLFWWGVVEFGIAIFAACLLRPTMRESGWVDDMLAGTMEAPEPVPGPKGKGHPRPHHAPVHRPAANPSMSMSLDLVLPLGVLVLTVLCAFMLGRTGGAETSIILGYGVPLLVCCLLLARPIRFGLAIGAVMLVHWFSTHRGEDAVFQSRSYFGHITVKRDEDRRSKTNLPFMTLIHGHINHGMNFLQPENRDQIGNPEKDLSRLATTYYHRLGPAGRVMEKYNWFPGPQNTYWADARMPASLVGNLVSGLGLTAFPVGEFVTLWSEPPYATVGLGTGTMASYSRPYQHMHYYEIDNQIRRLSLPWPSPSGTGYFTYQDLKEVGEMKRPYFTYLEQAIQRGSEVQVLMGDARLRMGLPYRNFHQSANDPVPGGGPDRFYHMMVIDAFSSDAIPAHLITLEAIEMYFDKLAEEGILCVHTSNRFVDLPKVVAAVANKKGYAYYRGHDNAPFEDQVGHFTSEWVMVARKQDYLEDLKNKYTPAGYEEAHRRKTPNARFEEYWTKVDTGPRYLWTDDYTNLMAVVRWGNR